MKKTVNQLISIFIVIVLTLVSYQSAFAAKDESPLAAGNVYYVSPAGSDINSCTQSAPCKSFNKAMSLAVSGDTVVALKGTYNQMVTIAKSGLTLEGQGATIDTTAQNGIYVKPNVQNIVIRGFTITRTNSHAIFIEGKYVTVENNTVYHTVLENGSLSGNTITCRNDSWGSAIKAGNGSSSLVIRNNTVYENCGEGIAATRSNDVTIENNTTYDNYGVNIYIDNSYNIRVLNNNGYCTVGVPAGIALGEESYSGWGAQLHDVLVSGNTVTNCYFGFVAFGSDVGGTLTNVTVSNNYFPTAARRGISVLSELNSNVLIQNNVHFNDIYVAFPTGVTLSGNTKVSGATVPSPTAVSPTKTSTPTAAPSTFTATPTSKVISPTFTSTALPTQTSAAAATFTAQPTQTSQQPATFTALPTQTSVVPTATATLPPIQPTATFTFTPEPTYTFTPEPTYTFTPEPTFTFTPTFTETPSPTMTASETPSPIPPTATNTQEPTVVVAPSEIVYDDRDPAFVYSPDWVDKARKKAYGGSYKETTQNGAYVTFTFTGQSFSILYTGGSSYRNMDVYVDDVLVGSIDQRIDDRTLQMRWDYTGQLSPGTHVLKLVFAKNKTNNNKRGSLDAVIVR